MEMASSQGGGALLFDQGGLDKLFGGLDKQYGGLMKKQARTLGGRWSTFTDTLRTELSKLFDSKSGKGIKMLLKWAAEEMPKAFKGHEAVHPRLLQDDRTQLAADPVGA